MHIWVTKKQKKGKLRVVLTVSNVVTLLIGHIQNVKNSMKYNEGKKPGKKMKKNTTSVILSSSLLMYVTIVML